MYFLVIVLNQYDYFSISFLSSSKSSIQYCKMDTYRDEIPLLTWQDVKSIISSNDLAKLGRSNAQKAEYFAFCDQLALNWRSTRDYILVQKFLFPETIDHDSGKKKANTDFLVENPGYVKFLLVENDYPYHFDKDIKHLILWKLGGESITEDEIQDFKMKVLHENKDIVDIVHYINPHHLKSIVDLEHAHLLYQIRVQQNL